MLAQSHTLFVTNLQRGLSGIVANHFQKRFPTVHGVVFIHTSSIKSWNPSVKLPIGKCGKYCKEPIAKSDLIQRIPIIRNIGVEQHKTEMWYKSNTTQWSLQHFKYPGLLVTWHNNPSQFRPRSGPRQMNNPISTCDFFFSARLGQNWPRKIPSQVHNTHLEVVIQRRLWISAQCIYLWSHKYKPVCG